MSLENLAYSRIAPHLCRLRRSVSYFHIIDFQSATNQFRSPLGRTDL